MARPIEEKLIWYKDFPLAKGYKVLGKRADWTTHIGICVRSCADLMGLFTYFESGGRTNAIIRDNRENDIAHVEWEWWEASSHKVIRNRTVLCKDMGPNCCNSPYFIPSNFMDLCKQQCQEAGCVVQQVLNKEAQMPGINFQRTYLLREAYESIKERAIQVLDKYLGYPNLIKF